MTAPLRERLADYLALRRALGYRLTNGASPQPDERCARGCGA